LAEWFDVARIQIPFLEGFFPGPPRAIWAGFLSILFQGDVKEKAIGVKILLVAVFLGAGKTTLMRHLLSSQFKGAGKMGLGVRHN